jgi:phosphoribosylformimino-5-aminoimidazole carboxamide ribotide isomerase
MIEIIPAMDIIGGKCVRLLKGDYNEKTEYSSDPLDMAKRFEDNGAKRLHLVDLDGARLHQIMNAKVLESIASGTRLCIDFGGGIKSNNDIDIAFNAGADMVTAGSIAVRNPAMVYDWMEKYGANRIILGADVNKGYIALQGWTEQSDLEICSFVGRYISKGINKVISTDISRDGTLQGPSMELYAMLLTAFPDLYVIASGGVSCIDDVAALEKSGVPAVIIGKALYENKISWEQLKQYL